MQSILDASLTVEIMKYLFFQKIFVISQDLSKWASEGKHVIYKNIHLFFYTYVYFKLKFHVDYKKVNGHVIYNYPLTLLHAI